jgi:hypothetical protein
MAKQYPTFTHPTLGTPVRLTKAMAKALAERARRHGHSRLGYEEGAQAVGVPCPLCREAVRGLYGPYCSAHTPTQALDRAMVEHLVSDCSSVTRP